jgi:hypothetical protein
MSRILFSQEDSLFGGGSRRHPEGVALVQLVYLSRVGRIGIRAQPIRDDQPLSGDIAIPDVVIGGDQLHQLQAGRLDPL